MRGSGPTAGAPVAVAPLPSRGLPRCVQFSVARSVQFSMAIDKPCVEIEIRSSERIRTLLPVRLVGIEQKHMYVAQRVASPMVAHRYAPRHPVRRRWTRCRKDKFQFPFAD